MWSWQIQEGISFEPFRALIRTCFLFKQVVSDHIAEHIDK